MRHDSLLQEVSSEHFHENREHPLGAVCSISCGSLLLCDFDPLNFFEYVDLIPTDWGFLFSKFIIVSNTN